MSDSTAGMDCPARQSLEIWVVTPCIEDDRDVAAQMARLSACLAQASHRVSLLVAPALDDRADRGTGTIAPPAVKLAFCQRPERPTIEGLPSVRRAFHVLRALDNERADLVLVPEAGGLGHFLATARRAGRLVAGARLVTVCVGAGDMLAEADGRLPASRDDVARDHMERCSVGWADAAVLASAPMRDWMQGQAWQLPAECVVLPPPIDDTAARPSLAPRVEEMVFAGGLRRSDGLVLFVQALRRLPPHRLARLRVTLLGHPAPGVAAWDPRRWLDTMLPAGLAWSIAPPEGDWPTAGRLAAPGCLIVAPGIGHVAPAAVRLCLAQGIPFLACDTPALRALVDPADAMDVLVPPRPGPLAEAMLRAIEHGLRPARPTQDPAALPGDWARLLTRLVDLPVPSAPQPAPHAGPEVSVVLVHHNRPALLAEALEGLRRQTWRDFEVLLVDDGSDLPEALTTLDALEAEFAARGWRILRGPNAWLGAARNRGWQAARGRYVLFHDDDNIALPHQIEHALAAARASGAAVVTSALAPFETATPPETPPLLRLALGGAVALGVFENGFGDAQALVRRDVLEQTGGFTEDFGLGHEDWELFARIALAGHEILALPEPLFWYRVAPGSMLRSRADGWADLRRGLRPYAKVIPPAMRVALLAGVADSYAVARARLEATAQHKAADSRWQRILDQRQVIEKQRHFIEAQRARIEALMAAAARRGSREEAGADRKA